MDSPNCRSGLYCRCCAPCTKGNFRAIPKRHVAHSHTPSQLSDAPGSDNGTGFFQTLCALKIREIYEKITSKKVAADPISVS